MSFLTPSSRWHALTTRDPLASHSFIYSVLTTRIYCRPTCPSRLARRANIIFHSNAAEANAAGFRACKRCRPDEDGGGWVEKARKLLDGEGKEGKTWSVKELARECGVTESHFCRVFRREMGITVGGYRARIAASSTTDPSSIGGSNESEWKEFDVPPVLPNEWASWPDGFTNEKREWLGNVEIVDIPQLADEDCFQFLDFDTCREEIN